MKQCIICGSHAFNLREEGIDQCDLCDKHYWQDRAEKAQEDAERLDFVIRQMCNVLEDMDGWYVFWPSSMRESDRFPTPREAIDAAITHREAKP